MTKVYIQKFREVDEDAPNGAKIVARFDCQIGPVRLFDCELHSTPKGRVAVTPYKASVAWGVLTVIRNEARTKLTGSPEGD